MTAGGERGGLERRAAVDERHSGEHGGAVSKRHGAGGHAGAEVTVALNVTVLPTVEGFGVESDRDVAGRGEAFTICVTTAEVLG